MMMLFTLKTKRPRRMVLGERSADNASRAGGIASRPTPPQDLGGDLQEHWHLQEPAFHFLAG